MISTLGQIRILYVDSMKCVLLLSTNDCLGLGSFDGRVWNGVGTELKAGGSAIPSLTLQVLSKRVLN